jgi:ubiquinone/menaquinone biosynthesis C-methylase UbiE
MLQFEHHAEKYLNVRDKLYPSYLYKKLAMLCTTHDAALDLGCGNGVSTVGLTPYFKHVMGVDVGKNLIKDAGKLCSNISFQVSSAEEFQTQQKYDLVTCATAFYWMNRELMLKKISNLLVKQGVFCAYKYNFPIAYGPLQDFIGYELATKWAAYRDGRLVNYDDTLELIQDAGLFCEAEMFVLPNTIDLTPEEVALFFLSTSYVTEYVDQSHNIDYPKWLIAEIKKVASLEKVKVNFDIYWNVLLKNASVKIFVFYFFLSVILYSLLLLGLYFICML